MTTENPLDGFVAEGAKASSDKKGSRPLAGIGLGNLGGVDAREYEARAMIDTKTGEVSVEGKGLDGTQAAKLKKIVKDGKLPFTAAFTNEKLLEITSECTHLHQSIHAQAMKEIAEYGSSEGTLRARFLLEGMTVALSWVLGFSTIAPDLYAKVKLLRDPEFLCPKPVCPDCDPIRAQKHPADVQIPVRGKKS